MLPSGQPRYTSAPQLAKSQVLPALQFTRQVAPSAQFTCVQFEPVQLNVQLEPVGQSPPQLVVFVQLVVQSAR
jgi:hypothetical protein